MALHTSLHKRQQTTQRIFRRALTMLLCLKIFQFEPIFIIKYRIILIHKVLFNYHIHIIPHINEMK